MVEFWECDYDKRYKEDPDFITLVDSEFTNLDPLRPRDALFGGRTNSTKLYQEIDESSNEEIKYIDVGSLYCLQVWTVSTWTSHHLFSREY